MCPPTRDRLRRRSPHLAKGHVISGELSDPPRSFTPVGMFPTIRPFSAGAGDRLAQLESKVDELTGLREMIEKPMKALREDLNKRMLVVQGWGASASPAEGRADEGLDAARLRRRLALSDLSGLSDERTGAHSPLATVRS